MPEDLESPSAVLDVRLGQFRALCDEPHTTSRVDALRTRLRRGHLRVLVAGEAKRGKSTLINALLGHDVLPCGALPVTSLATEIRQGDRECVVVEYRDATTDQVSVSELRAFVAESENPHNVKQVSRITVQLPVGLPHPMLTLIDTPGVGSVLAQNTDEALSAYEGMDAVVFVLTGDAPLSANELKLLREVSSLAVRSYVVLNKADLIADDELDEVIRFVSERVDTVTGTPTSILTCSATAALEARLSHDEERWLASGVPALRDALVLDLTVHRDDDVRRSVAAAGRRLAARKLDEATTVAAALDASAHQRADLIDSFAATLRGTERRRDDALHVLADQTRGELAELTAEAQRCQGPIVRQALRELEQLEAISTDTPADFEIQGRTTIDISIRSRVGAWHADWHERLANALLTQVARQQQLLQQDADRLTEAAREVLGVELSSAAIELDPMALPRLRLDFAAEVSWNSALVSALRMRGSARSARSRVHRHLREETARLVDKNIGRARANLQSSIEQSTARVRANVAQAFTEQAAVLRGAHDAVSGLTDRSAAEQVATRQAFAERTAALRDLNLGFDEISALRGQPDTSQAPAPQGAR